MARGAADKRALVNGRPGTVERYHLRAAATLLCGHVAALAVGAAQSTYGYEDRIADVTSFAFLSLAIMLGMPENRLRVITPEVGGGFGSKLNVYAEEALVGWIAQQLNRPVKWIESRRENFLGTIHGRSPPRASNASTAGTPRNTLRVPHPPSMTAL